MRGFLQLGDRLLEERQRLVVLALVVEEPSLDVARHRERRIRLPREAGFLPRRLRIPARERDLRQHFVRRRPRPPVGFGGDVGRERGVLGRFVELVQLEQRRRGADVPVRIGRPQHHHVA